METPALDHLVAVGTLHRTMPSSVGAITPRLPPEIAFLAGCAGVAIDRLEQAAALARDSGVTADVALIAGGLMAEGVFYRHLARHLGLPFAEHPPRPAETDPVHDVLHRGYVALTANPESWRFLVAPRGPALVTFLKAASVPSHEAGPRLVLTMPSRFEALVRHNGRHDVSRLASHGLPDWNRALSAHHGLSGPQALALVVTLTAVILAVIEAPAVFGVAVDVVFFVAFSLAVGLRLAATMASRDVIGEATVRTPDRDLPIYSVVVPLFREARVVDRLVQALDALDYPRAKLDIVIMVEANDRDTLEALERRGLPGCYRVIMAPPGRPQTKPRALNVALQFVRGAHVVIYDAEDDPEPQQLRDAAARFRADPALACLQARLAIDNIEDGWLTRLFTVEYAALFHVINPGLAALGLPIPLGGTSNHFRTAVLRRLNGWDAWNVTEDIDLGIRLARYGLKVGSLASTTFEEAPNTLKAWLAQRTRWQKGWIVTLVTHSRHPRRLWRDLGLTGTTAVAALLVGTIASCLLGPVFVVTLGLRLWSGRLWTGPTAVWTAAGLLLFAAGTSGALWSILLGLHRRGTPQLVRTLGWLPLYLGLLSLAAWLAAFEVVGRPYVWTKTEHGRAKKRLRSGGG